MSEALEDFLDDYRQEGEVDSRGSFTVAGERAQELLGELRFADPARYALNVVATAVLSGASCCSLEESGSEAVFSWDSVYTPNQLTDLFSHLLGGADPALRELAVAVKSAQQLGASVSLAVWEGDRGHSYHFKGKTQTDRRFDWQGAPVTRLRVDYGWRPRSAVRWFRRLMDERLPEGRYLSTRCGYSPIPILLGGFSVNCGLGSDDRIGSCRLGEPPQICHHYRPTASMQLESEVDGWVFLGRGGDVSYGDSRLHIILNGVDYVGKLGNAYGHVEAYVWTQQLRTDLSYSGIVQEARFHQLLAEVERASAALAREWLATRDPNERNRGLYARVARDFASEGSLALADGRLQKLADFFLANKDPRRAAGVLRELAAIKYRLGQFKPAHTLLNQALELTDREEQTAAFCSCLANVELALHRPCEDDFERSQSLFEKFYMERKPHNVAEVVEARAWAHRRQGDVLGAVELFLEARRLKLIGLPHDHWRHASTFEGLAICRLDLKSLKEATVSAETALELCRSRYGEQDPLTLTALTLLALCQGPDGEALKERRRVAELNFAEGHPERLSTEVLEAGLAARRRDHHARERLQQCYQKVCHHLGDSMPVARELEALLGREEFGFREPENEFLLTVDYRGWFDRRQAKRCTLPLQMLL